MVWMLIHQQDRPFPMGDPVAWTYVVTNTGNVTLAVVVSDDQGVSVSCPETSLAPADDMTCNAIGVAVAGQYANIGTADGTPDVGAPVQATDPSHYFGEDSGDDDREDLWNAESVVTTDGDLRLPGEQYG